MPVLSLVPYSHPNFPLIFSEPEFPYVVQAGFELVFTCLGLPCAGVHTTLGFPGPFEPFQLPG